MFIDLQKRINYYGNGSRYHRTSSWTRYRWALLAILIIPLLLILYMILRRRKTRQTATVYPATNQDYYQNQPMKQEGNYYAQSPTYPNNGTNNYANDGYNTNNNYGPGTNNTTTNAATEEYYPPAGAPPSDNYQPPAGPPRTETYDNYNPPAGPPPTHVKS